MAPIFYLLLLLLCIVLLIWYFGDHTPLDNSFLRQSLQRAEQLKRQESPASYKWVHPEGRLTAAKVVDSAAKVEPATVAKVESAAEPVIEPTSTNTAPLRSCIREMMGPHANIIAQCREYKKHTSISYGEYICIATMETIFQRPFPKGTYDFLTSTNTGRQLELDGYNQELKLAIEYNGEQHYNGDHEFWRGDINKFNTQVRNDRYKSELCVRFGITLLIVHYKVKLEQIPEYIAELLPPEFDPYRHDLCH